MKKYVVLLAVILAATTASVFGYRETYSVPRSYVYMITGKTPPSKEAPKGSQRSGSAVVIHEGYALTAAHVLAGGSEFRIHTDAGVVPFRIVKIDIENDLALIHAPVLCPCVKIAETVPEVDAEVVAVGYPLAGALGQIQIVTSGLYHGTTVQTDQVVTTAAAAPGSSGGGLFVKVHTNQYHLLGIVVQIPVIGQHLGAATYISFSTSPASIRKFLEDTPVSHLVKDKAPGSIEFTAP